jgi:Flp pilus assembly protein TadG
MKSGRPPRGEREPKRHGGCALEMALILPWYIFLFVGAFDWGYYSHALISVQSAVRVAGLYAASQSSVPSVSAVCPYVRNELKIVANVTDSLTCTASPVVLSVTSVTGADGNPAYKVSLTYTTVQLIAIPGLLTNQATFTRTLQMRPRV